MTKKKNTMNDCYCCRVVMILLLWKRRYGRRRRVPLLLLSPTTVLSPPLSRCQLCFLFLLSVSAEDFFVSVSIRTGVQIHD